MAAMVLASAAKPAADNLAVIHPCSQVEKRIEGRCRQSGGDPSLQPGGKEDQRCQDQQIGDETSPASFAAERSLHIHEIAVKIGDKIGQEEREHISPGHNPVNHIGRGPLKQCVRPEDRAQNRRQFGRNAVKNQGQQISEGKLQQRDAEGYQIKY